MNFDKIDSFFDLDEDNYFALSIMLLNKNILLFKITKIPLEVLRGLT